MKIREIKFRRPDRSEPSWRKSRGYRGRPAGMARPALPYGTDRQRRNAAQLAAV